jgi:DNA repair protein RadC
VPTTDNTLRRDRYRAVIDTLVRNDRFGLKSIQQACAPETGSFVTRIVNQLARQGWLLREDHPHEVMFAWHTDRSKFPVARWLDEQAATTTIAHSPPDDRPRERLLKFGAATLRTAELLAILIRAGRRGESALQGGEKIANAFQNGLERLPQSRLAELRALSSSVGESAYCQIMAGIELGRRIAEHAQSKEQLTRITGSADAVDFCRRRFHRLISDARQEEFHVVCLNTKNQVIATHRVFVGTLNASLVHPREIFRTAIKDCASSIILVHNHPSGDPTPSREDYQATQRLEESGKLLGIDVLDHVVLGSPNCVSIREIRAQEGH